MIDFNVTIDSIIGNIDLFMPRCPLETFVQQYQTSRLSWLLFPKEFQTLLKRESTPERNGLLLQQMLIYKTTKPWMSRFFPFVKQFYGSSLFSEWQKIKLIAAPGQTKPMDFFLEYLPHASQPIFGQAIRLIRLMKLEHEDKIWQIFASILHEEHPNYLAYFHVILESTCKLQLSNLNKKIYWFITDDRHLMEYAHLLLKFCLENKICKNEADFLSLLPYFSNIDEHRGDDANIAFELERLIEFLTALKGLSTRLTEDYTSNELLNTRLKKSKALNKSIYLYFLGLLLPILMESDGPVLQNRLKTDWLSDLNHAFFVFVGNSSLLINNPLMRKFLRWISQSENPSTHAQFLFICFKIDNSFQEETEDFYLEFAHYHKDRLQKLCHWMKRLASSHFSAQKKWAIMKQINQYDSILDVDWGAFTLLPLFLHHEISDIIHLAQRFEEQREPSKKASEEIEKYARTRAIQKRHIIKASQHPIEFKDNTLLPSIRKSCSQSAKLLLDRYGYQLNETTRNFVLSSTLFFLKSASGKRHNIFSKIPFGIAEIWEAFIDSDFTYVDPDSNIHLYDLCALVCLAIRDQDCYHPSSNIIERYRLFCHCLDTISKVSYQNKTKKFTFICPEGIFCKMLEFLNGHHCDVNLIMVNYGVAGWKLKALVTQHVQHYFSKLALSSADSAEKRFLQGCNDSEALLYIWPEIFETVRLLLQEEFSGLFESEDDLNMFMEIGQDVDIKAIHENWLKQISKSNDNDLNTYLFNESHVHLKWKPLASHNKPLTMQVLPALPEEPDNDYHLSSFHFES